MNKQTAYNIAKVSNLTWSVSAEGYRHSYIVTSGKRFNILRHVLNFYIAYGYIPELVDHKDGIPGNDEPSNLRAATKSTNMCNSKKRCDNKSGVKGVIWYPRTGKWKVQVTANGVQHHGGYFPDIVQAEEASKKLRARLHGEFSNHG
ncbi:HNH endonuclease [Erwinia phage Papaline]|nr:HNH endonuclease [Erwinia phage Papaline]